MSENKQNFSLQKIYLKDVSFESPQAIKYFQLNSKQFKINLELNTESAVIEDNLYEIVLSLVVTASIDRENQEAATVYLVELKQAGIFHLAGFAEKDLHRMINSYCPNILFPYAREAVSGLVDRGGFPQLLLAPINFDALYEQHLQKLKMAEQNPSSDAKH